MSSPVMNPYHPAVTYAHNLKSARASLSNQVELTAGGRCVKPGALLAAQNEVKHWESLLRAFDHDTIVLACIEANTAIVEPAYESVAYPQYDSLYPVTSAVLDEVWTEYDGRQWWVNAQWIVTTEIGAEMINVLTEPASFYHACQIRDRFRSYFGARFVNGVMVHCQDGAIVTVSI